MPNTPTPTTGVPPAFGKPALDTLVAAQGRLHQPGVVGDLPPRPVMEDEHAAQSGPARHHADPACGARPAGLPGSAGLMSEAMLDHAGVRAEPALDRRTLAAAIAPYMAPSLRRSLWQFGSTFAAFIALDAAMYVCLHLSVWLAMALAFPAAGLMVRLFIVQHDCGHGAFFRSRRANDMLGRLCSVITFTPYAFWRRQHANHHASFNNLDRRDTGIDIYSTCATLAEYHALSRPRRLLYRVTHHPIVTQLLLPPFVFLLLYRVPFDATDGWRRERLSVYATNIVIAGVIAALMIGLGVWPVVLVQLPILVITSIVGVWLFSVQHRFEEAQWLRQAEWTPVQAALHGSSYLKLPRVLQWFTGNIGYHHVHHLAARVPNYRLQECHEARPELGTVTVLSLWQALLAPSYALWDEEAGCMARFPSTR